MFHIEERLYKSIFYDLSYDFSMIGKSVHLFIYMYIYFLAAVYLFTVGPRNVQLSGVGFCCSFATVCCPSSIVHRPVPPNHPPHLLCPTKLPLLLVVWLNCFNCKRCSQFVKSKWRVCFVVVCGAWRDFELRKQKAQDWSRELNARPLGYPLNWVWNKLDLKLYY